MRIRSFVKNNLPVLLFALIMSQGTSAMAESVTVDTGTRYQTMTGWEVTGRLWQFDKANDRFNPEWESHSEQIFDKLVNELGINRFRLEALSGIENTEDYWRKFEDGKIGYSELRSHFYEKLNDDNDPNSVNNSNFQFGYMDYVVEKMLLPIKALVEANGESLYINLNYVDFKWTDLKGNLHHATSPEEYAEFVLASFDHLKSKYNLVPDAFELILEPDNTTHWSGDNIGLGLLAVRKRLNNAGYFPEFIAPSTANAAKALPYFNSMLAIEGVAEALTTLSYHRYHGTPSESVISDIAKAASEHNLRTAMLEHVGADMRELWQDLTVGNVSAWQQYGIATNIESNAGGYYYKVNLDNANNPNIYLDKRAVDMPLIFKNVRMGATRIGATSDSSGLEVAAFENADGKVTLLVNSDQETQIELRGLPNGNYVSQTSTPITAEEESALLTIDADTPFLTNVRSGLTAIYTTTAQINVTEEPPVPVDTPDVTDVTESEPVDEPTDTIDEPADVVSEPNDIEPEPTETVTETVRNETIDTPAESVTDEEPENNTASLPIESDTPTSDRDTNSTDTEPVSPASELSAASGIPDSESGDNTDVEVAANSTVEQTTSLIDPETPLQAPVLLGFPSDVSTESDTATLLAAQPGVEANSNAELEASNGSKGGAAGTPLLALLLSYLVVFRQREFRWKLLRD